MIGLVLLTHGQMAAECLRSAEMIIGPIADCRAVSIDRSHSVEDATRGLRTAVSEVCQENGVLILTDLFGGTPTNIAASLMAEGAVDILAGFNLPMLIKAASARHHKNLDELADFLREYGRQAIVRPADLLKARSK